MIVHCRKLTVTPVAAAISAIAGALVPLPTGVAMPPMFAAQAMPRVLASTSGSACPPEHPVDLQGEREPDHRDDRVRHECAHQRRRARNIMRKRGERPRTNGMSRNASAKRRLTPVASSAAARPNEPTTNHSTQLLECAKAAFTLRAPERDAEAEHRECGEGERQRRRDPPDDREREQPQAGHSDLGDRRRRRQQQHHDERGDAGGNPRNVRAVPKPGRAHARAAAQRKARRSTSALSERTSAMSTASSDFVGWRVRGDAMMPASNRFCFMTATPMPGCSS